MSALRTVLLRRLTDRHAVVDRPQSVGDAPPCVVGDQAGLERDHAAADVHPDRVWNDRICGRQHGANGHAVAHVRVGHDGHGHRHGKRSDIPDLHEGVRLDALLGEPAPCLLRPATIGADLERDHVPITLRRVGMSRDVARLLPTMR